MKSKNKLIYGVGINDADYLVMPRINGKQVMCPFYQVWQGMLERCYSAKTQEKYPTYRGCVVSKEWLIFSNFREWMQSQKWKGLQLDKDILIEGNKIYAPEYCRFVSHPINSLLNDHGRSRGKYPIGVSMDKRNGRFQAQCSVMGKLKYIGLYSSPEAAYRAWRGAKAEAIRLTVDAESPAEEIRMALLARAIELESIPTINTGDK